MSEYQYYEFQAIDRPLDESEMRKLRAISSRAHITATSFVNSYNFGDFRGSPSTLMEKYFDAFLYLANWGTHQLAYRLLKKTLDPKTASRYLVGRHAQVRTKGEFVILEFLSDDETGEMETLGEGELSPLIPVREEVARGDLRALYLGWLLSVQAGEVEDDAIEPPPPPGLRKLSASLRSFANFLRIDSDLIRTAAEESPDAPSTALSSKELASRIAALPGSEKDAILLRLARGADPLVREQLMRRLLAHTTSPDPAKAARRQAAKRRTAGELRNASERPLDGMRQKGR